MIMGKTRAAIGVAAVAALTVMASALPASGQLIQSQPLGPVGGGAPPAAKAPAPAPTQPKQSAPAAKAPAAASSNDAPRASGDGQLGRRVDQLEEQMTDLQVVIGTLESLARNPGSGVAAAPLRPQGGGLSPGEQGRIDALETQVRALTIQIEQLVNQMGAGGAAPPLGRRSELGTGPASDMRGTSGPTAAPSAPGGFGQTTVTAESDPIGQIIENDTRPGRQVAASAPLGGATGDQATSPDQLYKASYSYLLQQNWGEAEAGFDEFLRRYPNDAMAGNAQYWLGEVYFTRGEYKQAASAFLKGSKSYAKSVKAPDSMLMLAMSLDRLGQRDAACQAFGELTARYPNLPTNLRDRAASGRTKAGC
jgi:tol-pal system protein YbgF